MSWRTALKKAFLVKPLHVAISEGIESDNKLERSLTLFDLTCIGVGGTVGSGIFVLTGLIASEFSGPGVVFSWLLGGLACTMSALSYAELSCIIPSAGSSYVYVYLGIGELPAYVTAICLSIEYGISGTAVASSWGIKFQNLLSNWNSASSPQNGGITVCNVDINIYGGILQFAVMLLLLRGVHISKNVINFFTVMKLVLITFIVMAGIALFKSSNISVWTPYGVKGIFRGAASCFFGYLGYDELCCMAGEAIDPKRNLPRAVLGTISIVTVVYVIAAFILVGMQPYSYIDPNSGFSQAFKWNGWVWAQQIVAVGEVVTLPLVVLVSFLAQPRLQYAVSMDGLLPALFREIDRKGNLTKGIWISGIICTLVTIFVPFQYLDDIISAGVLVSFNLTNASLIILRYQHSISSEDSFIVSSTLSDDLSFNETNHSGIELLRIDSPKMSRSDQPLEADVRLAHPNLNRLCILLCYFHILTIVMSCILAIANSTLSVTTKTVCISLSFLVAAVLILLSVKIRNIFYMRPHVSSPSLSRKNNPTTNNGSGLANETSEVFRVPFMPFTPLIGTVVNYYLLTQLSWFGLLAVMGILLLTITSYFMYSIHKSVGNNQGWAYHNSRTLSDSNAEGDITNIFELGDDLIEEVIDNSQDMGRMRTDSNELSTLYDEEVYSPLDFR